VSTTSPPAGGNHPLIDDLLEEVALRERVRAHYARRLRRRRALPRRRPRRPARDRGAGQPRLRQPPPPWPRCARVVSVAFTHRVADGLHSAIIKATKPIDAEPAAAATNPASQTALPLASQPGCC
jgi:hypothetical protein